MFSSFSIFFFSFFLFFFFFFLWRRGHTHSDRVTPGNSHLKNLEASNVDSASMFTEQLYRNYDTGIAGQYVPCNSKYLSQV